MIIGAEVQGNELMISYYNDIGRIEFIRKRVSDSDIFNWVESDRPTIHKNWDGKYIKSAKSDPMWLSRTRIEELILEKLNRSELDLIYNFDNSPKISFQDIEIQLISDDFPYPEKALMPVNLISFCNEDGVTYVLSIMQSEEYPGGLSDSDILRMESEVNQYFKETVPHDESDRKILSIDFKIKHRFFKSEKELLTFYF